VTPLTPADRSRPRPAEGGSLTVEAVVLVPVVMVFFVVALALGRVEMAREQVVGAARAAAEAAAVMPSAAQAQWAAAAAATPALYGRSHSCASGRVTTDTAHFTPGGDVSVTVTCTVSLSDLVLPGLPGTTTVVATATAPIDPYRSVSS